MSTTSKPTAALLHADDKAVVVKIRDASGLNERDTMKLIIAAASKVQDGIIAEGQKMAQAVKAEQQKSRESKQEVLRSKMKEARAQIRAAAAPAATAPKPTAPAASKTAGKVTA